MFKLFRRLSDSAAIAVGALVVLMMLHISAEVILRLFFGTHFPGTMEIVTYYYMVASVFIGIFSCTMRDAHIRVDVVAQYFKGRFRRIVDIFGWLVISGYFCLFAYGLHRQAERSWNRSETVDAISFEIPIWPARWLALIAIALAAVGALTMLYHYYLSSAAAKRAKDS